MFKKNIRAREADYVVPIPSHEDKVKNRGFNQTEVICDEFIKHNDLISLKCLNQDKNIELRPLNLLERYTEVKNMFSFKIEFQQHIQDKYIILLDDVVTTAATVSECAKILKSNGARKVDGLSLGRTKLDDDG